MIDFTLRELKCAWRQAGSAFEAADNKTNAHRLLLFYAVETGLKAILLKRESKQDSRKSKQDPEDKFPKNEFSDFQHDLNKLMAHLRVGAYLHLKTEISLDDLNHPKKPRKSKYSELNQIWRYGAKAKKPTDAELESQLLAIQEWIKGELR